MRWFALTAALLLTSAGAAVFALRDQPFFTDVYLASGLTHVPHPGGVALSDYDGDGDLDVLFTGDVTRLFRNDGTAHFEDVTKSAHVDYERVPMGIFADYDNDGCPDLFLTGLDMLLHNQCDGTFRDVSDTSGIARHGERHSGAANAAWADYDNDGDLDLYIANHGMFDYFPDKHPTYIFDANVLYRNDGGKFTDVTARAGVSGVSTCGLKAKSSPALGKIFGQLKRSFQPVWFDYDSDGYPDLFVATDEGVSTLYRNNGNGTFSEATKQAGLCRINSNMGVAIGDYDNDGDPDLYVTNGGANYLWRNNGDGAFEEVAAAANAADQKHVGWGAAFVDFDNDMDLDLYVVNGLKDSIVLEDTPTDAMYVNGGDGVFKEANEHYGVSGDDSKEKLAVGDLDGNGTVDAIVVSATDMTDDKSRLYLTEKKLNHWLQVRLIGRTLNRDAIGAVVTVVVGNVRMTRYVSAGESFQSQHSLWQNFGLGLARKADSIEVKWPGGGTQVLHDVEGDRVISITQQ